MAEVLCFHQLAWAPRRDFVFCERCLKEWLPADKLTIAETMAAREEVRRPRPVLRFPSERAA